MSERWGTASHSDLNIPLYSHILVSQKAGSVFVQALM